MKTSLLVSTLVPLLAGTLCTRNADACGGCFVPPSDSSIVTGHRMVMSVSANQSVLWDQIQYSGNPAEFAWVLPVKSGGYIEAANDAWFETLEAATTVKIFAPPINCGNSGGGGCLLGGAASSDEAAAFGANGGGDPVQVLHEGTVGPYETVTLKTSTPGALNDWLTEHGYSIDESTQPIVDAYVAEKFDFIAIRLKPGAGVQQMKPVRVITPGAGATLPLRMVAAGTGAKVSIVLYVIGEGRWATDNFPSTAIPIDLISWDFNTSESNYGVLRDKALGGGDGRSWLTTYARSGALFADINPPNTFTPGPTLFNEVYAAQGIADGEATDPCTIPNLAGEDRVVTNPCPAGAPPDDPSCMPTAGEVDSRSLACGTLDDLAVALTGMHPKDVWVARLEANLPREALDTDLTLKAADRQERVNNSITARVAVNAEEFCGAATPVLRSPEDRRRTSMLVAGICVLALASALGRRRSRAVAA